MSTFSYPPRMVRDVANASHQNQQRFRIGARVYLALFVIWVLAQSAMGIHGYFSSQQVEKQDPEQVFYRVFKAWPPAGVTQIKAAGEIGRGGGNYWMVIKTTDFPALVSVLKRNATSTGHGALDKYEPSADVLKRKAASVDWELAHHVDNPQYYESVGTPGWPKSGLIMDSARKSVYVGVSEN